MLLVRSILLLIFVSSQTLGVLWAQDQKEGEFFILPESTLKAADRKLESETDPYKKYQILFKWVRIKEEVEKGLSADSDEFLRSKKEIISKLEESAYEFAQYKDLDMIPLFRELAFRHAELREFQKAIEYFQRIPEPTPDDHLALGNAYFNSDRVDQSLTHYEIASNTPRLRSSASYKKAWAYLRKNNFALALKEFDICLTDRHEGNVALKAEAFQDRLRPYLETFSASDFDRADNEKLLKLATMVYKDDAEERNKIYTDALRSLVEGFNAKSRVAIAQNVFFFLSEASEDTIEVLLLSAPTWIKVYRGRLDHKSVLKILKSLPEQQIPMDQSSSLRAEIYNTAVFYESYKEDENEREEAWELLRMTYLKYFQLYPLDKEADPLRVNYGRILLNDGNAKECLVIMKNRGGKDEAVEKIAYSLEGKCELKYLDQLYAADHTDEFYTMFNAALLKTKIYLRPDLGVPSEAAFDSLGRMLIGSLGKNSNSEILRKTLSSLILEYPYNKETQLYYDLQTVQAELKFKDLLAADLDLELKAEGFFEIYNEARKGTQVAEKSLTNSIVMGRQEKTLDRCPIYEKNYSAQFVPGENVFDKCIQLSEHFLQLETEYGFWKLVLNKLSKAQLLRVGLLEMALGLKPGRSRVESLGTEEARNAIEIWDGVSPKPIPLDSRWNNLEMSSQDFLSRLKPIKLAQIQKAVPRQIKAFEKMESQLVEYFNEEPSPYWAAQSLEMRSRITQAFAEWMQKLPIPSDLSPEELEVYQEKTQEIVQPWNDRALAARTSCSEIAYTLTPHFKQNDSNHCPEETKSSEFRKRMREWRTSIPRNDRVSQLIRVILNKASAVEDLKRAKYYSFRALELSQNDRERANSFLLLARKADRPMYWKAASDLDGALIEPIQWRKKQAEGNPFYERLFEAQIRQIRAQGQR